MQVRRRRAGALLAVLALIAIVAGVAWAAPTPPSRARAGRPPGRLRGARPLLSRSQREAAAVRSVLSYTPSSKKARNGHGTWR